MRFLAAWFADPAAYWMHITLLVLIVIGGVWGLRKLQAKRRS